MSGFLSAGIVGGPDIPDSLVTRYDCENSNSDTNVIADIIDGNDGTNKNGVGFTASGGPDSTGEYNYDRSQSQFTNTSIQGYNDSFTFALLAKHTDVDNVDLMADVSGEISGFQFTYRTGNFQFQTLDTGSNTTISTNVDTSGVYQWFIMTHSESNDQTHGYINKTQFGPVTQSHKPNPDSDVKIAKRGSRSTNHPTMDLADFRYYNKPISQSEVDSLVDTGSI
jgi:hypothetical protein